MKKYWGLLAVSLALSLTACGNKNNSSSTTASSKSTVSSTIKTVAYSDLSKKQQEKIFFQFKALQDIASGDGNHNMPAPFMVDMTVKNNSKQSVTFDQSKFLMFDENGDAPTVKSSKSGMLTLKPGAQQKIHSIFKNVQSQTLVGRGAFYYINTDFKLAYYLNANKGVDSNNLKSGEAKDLNDTPAHPQQSVASSSEASQAEAQDNTKVAQNGSNDYDEDTNDDGNSDGSISPTLKVTPGAQYSSFSIKNMTDKPITLQGDMWMPMADYHFIDLPATIAGESVTIQPGQVHVYPNFFEGHTNAEHFTLSYGNGGNMLWTSK
ncbi:hypothetical protein FC83_GL002604 [Agrilactobacillus composti DSM 18527 = JCM 14202]|uniref:DUF4352 domain-containing protein n=1 Tax=Agrilactobacillus composti DSM 18527 = JCM 14202 TaxID=1423734 RepID=X0QSL0_9LACO|nr:hypothetical protein [Agrilactobacillus composti]KRM36729.1 hypothetical protein FC83_GL002604 [Agrilactobacillus composti DSM 18527 = JCM 14202]GAF41590.1 hypothetical protein JCM14202_3540 [Agrilactobacillus composti DSM 18527 = JCM 14202]